MGWRPRVERELYGTRYLHATAGRRIIAKGLMNKRKKAAKESPHTKQQRLNGL